MLWSPLDDFWKSHTKISVLYRWISLAAFKKDQKQEAGIAKFSVARRKSCIDELNLNFCFILPFVIIIVAYTGIILSLANAADITFHLLERCKYKQAEKYHPNLIRVLCMWHQGKNSHFSV